MELVFGATKNDDGAVPVIEAWLVKLFDEVVWESNIGNELFVDLLKIDPSEGS